MFCKKSRHIVNTNNKKFSELIIELTEMWLTWMPKNKLSHNAGISYEDRRIYAKECEVLINREDEIVGELDKYFEIKNE